MRSARLPSQAQAPRVGLSSLFDERTSFCFKSRPSAASEPRYRSRSVFRRRLQHHLILVVMLHAVRILAIAAIFRAARRLHIRGAPRLRADRAQEGAGVESAGADFHVVRLEQGATLLVPIGLQGQDNLLKCEHRMSSPRGRLRFVKVCLKPGRCCSSVRAGVLLILAVFTGPL